MKETNKSYHEVLDWTTEEIQVRLGFLVLNGENFSPRELAEAATEINCLQFEIDMRDGAPHHAWAVEYEKQG